MFNKDSLLLDEKNDDFNSQDLVPIKDIFQKTPKIKIGLGSEIMRKKNLIRSMIVSELGVPKTIKRERKPSALRRLEKGLKKLFFKKDGPVIQKFPKIRQEIIQNDNIRKRSLFDSKINLGSLTYYTLKEGDISNKTEAYLNEHKKGIFERSSHFTIKKERDPLLELHDVSQVLKKKKKILPSSTKSGFKLNEKMAKYMIKENPDLEDENEENENNKKNNWQTSPNRMNSSIVNGVNKTSRQRNRENQTFTNKNLTEYNTFYKSFSNNSSSNSNTVSIPNTKKMKTTIIKKVEKLGNKQHKMEKKLFRIIDRAQNNNKMKCGIDRDLETILGAKIKKKKKFGQTKEFYIQAVKIKDDYSLMDSKKAQLLKLSDSINNLTDEVALKFADRLIEAYYQKTVLAKLDIPLVAPDVVKKKLKIEGEKLRSKINHNNEILKKMGFNAEKEKINLNKTYQKFKIY